MIFTAAVTALITLSSLNKSKPQLIRTPQVSLASYSAPLERLPTSEENRLVTMLNKERADEFLVTLRSDRLLTEIAYEHSVDMAQRAYFDHVSPDPNSTTPATRYIDALGHTPSYATIGENIYYLSGPMLGISLDSAAHAAFNASPEHRANMLNPVYRSVGIGIYHSPSGASWVTEMFLVDDGERTRR